MTPLPPAFVCLPCQVRFVPVESGDNIHMTHEFAAGLPVAERLNFRCPGISNLQTCNPLVEAPQIMAEANGPRTCRVVDDGPRRQVARE